MWTLDQGQTQQEDWTLITWWGRAHKEGMRIGKKPQNNKIAFDVLDAKELMQKL
jgi:hypothetical protein